MDRRLAQTGYNSNPDGPSLLPKWRRPPTKAGAKRCPEGAITAVTKKVSAGSLARNIPWFI